MFGNDCEKSTLQIRYENILSDGIYNFDRVNSTREFSDNFNILPIWLTYV